MTSSFSLDDILPVNLDETYEDSTSDPSQKLHQRLHDTLNARVNLIKLPSTGIIPDGSTLVGVGGKLEVKQPTLASGTQLVAAWDTDTSRWLYPNGNEASNTKRPTGAIVIYTGGPNAEEAGVMVYGDVWREAVTV